MNEEEKIPKKTGYLTNAGRGLQRLETEKLSFLGESQVISKFDSDNLAAFAPEAEPEEKESGVSSDDAFLSEQDLLTDVFAARTDTASLDVQNVDSEALKFPSTETIELDGENGAEFKTSSTNSTITTSSGFSTPALAALVAQRVAERSAQNASTIQVGGHPKVTLDFAAIRNYQSVTDIAENSSEEDEDSLDNEETHDVGDIAEDMRLEYGPTVDIGKEAERVREALANGIIPDISIGQPTSVSPNSMMFKQAETQPAERLEEPNTAIEKLKQQGLFEPMTSHAEVDQVIEHIHSLDNLIPPSTVSSYQGNFPTNNHGGLSTEELIGEETVSHDPGIREEINQNAVNKKTVVLAGEEPKQQFVPTPQVDDPDLDSRETMPIDCIPPELLATSPALKAKPSKAVEFEPSHKKRSKLESFNPRLAAWIILCSLLFICIVFILYLVGLLSWISPSLDPQHKNVHFKLTSNEVVEEEFSTDDVMDMDALVNLPEAIHTASEQVHKAIAFDSWMDSWIEKQINEQTTAEARLSALEMGMEFYPNQNEYLQKYVETAIEAQKYEEAKAVLQTAPESFRNSAEAFKYKYKILQNDPKFMPPETYLTEEMCDEIAPLGGGSTVTLKFKKDGKNIGAFKPNQTLGQSNYRAEIAAWRLCQLLECDFEIPWNRPILVEHALFEKLYARTKSAKKSSYRTEMKAIRWQTTKVNDKKTTYVIGTLKDWVPDFTRFPIELTSFWKPWLAQKNYIETYKPLKEALSPLSRNQNTKKLLPEILSNSPELTTNQLAAQISDVLVFDYLVGNWDRFSGVGSWWGVNCQYKDNHIVSIDNGAAFPKTVNDKVYQRYMMTERFSAHFIQALRNLDKDLTLECLFPNASKYEKEAYELFWKQRNAVLKRIDTLISKYGEDKVLSL